MRAQLDQPIVIRAASVLLGFLLLAGVAGAVAKLTGTGARADEPDPGIVVADVLPEGKPVPLTEEQCKAAADIVAVMSADRSRVADRLGMKGLAETDAAIADSSGWVSQGCPADDVRGFYPNPSGQGGELRVFRQQTFTGDGTSFASMEREK